MSTISHRLYPLMLSLTVLVACGQEQGPAGPAGPAGEKGIAGPAGESCSVSMNASQEPVIMCADGSSFTIPPGETCTIQSPSDGSAPRIVCPDGSDVTLPEAGEQAEGCELDEREDGAVYLVCEGSGEVEVRPATPANQESEPVWSLLAGVTSVGSSDGVGVETRMDGALDGTFDAQGDFLYFVDTFNMTVRRFGVRTGRVVTLAGTPGRKGAADGVGADASFDGPRGVALHPDGERLFIADGFNCTIRQLNLVTRLVTTLAGSVGSCEAVDGPLEQARFRLTIGMTMEPSGRYIYLSDRGNNVIRRIDLQEGVVETIAGTLPTGSPGDVRGAVDGVGDEARFSGPGGIALSADADTLFVNDTFNSTIRAISLEDRTAQGGAARFTVSTLAGQAGSSGHLDGVGAAASFQISQGLTRLGDQLYVSGFHGTIRRIDPATQQVITVAGSAGTSGSADGPARDARFGTSFGIIGSPDERHVYYMDRGNNSIRRFDTVQEEVETVMGASEPVGWRDGAPGVSRLDSPGQVWGSEDGRRVYLIDRGNHIIRRFDRDANEITTIAGLPGRAGFEDGTLDEARFDSPFGIWVDTEERFAYVTDTGNNAIRRLDLQSGEVSTILGGPGQEDSNQDGVLATARLIAPRAIIGRAVNGEAPDLFVTETHSHTVRLIDLEGQTMTTLAGGGMRDAEREDDIDGVGVAALFDSPSGLALDTDATALYIADQGHHVIRRMDLSNAEVTTVAGDVNEPDAFDGTGVDATFDGPAQLALSDVEDVLYVADVGNHAIRRLEMTSAQVTTVVGTLGISGGSGLFKQPLPDVRLYFPTGVATAPDGLFLTADEALMHVTPSP